MDPVGVLVRFDAEPDKVDEVEAFLRALVAQAHLAAAGEAMRATASELFTAAPAVDHVDIVSAKLPS